MCSSISLLAGAAHSAVMHDGRLWVFGGDEQRTGPSSHVIRVTGSLYALDLRPTDGGSDRTARWERVQVQEQAQHQKQK